ncbi:N-acetyl-gamma-glutamyl-phosphate reductase [Kangiella sp. TOML190]|uniref:N-acetyl-gamma-glutamyl-phosphate reductase n=1 Tax=Kangiella sp. TOML190 TaxID=2931351 RepID=UPI00203ED0D2|nr:N-acetyl-gamma-glutamyl-phosphate reductase [Kangiella sp. TOML190]
MHNKIRIALVGARGYVGKELIELLQNHPKMELIAAFSRQLSGKPVLADEPLRYQDSTPENVSATEADAYILALPNGFCEQYASLLVATHPQAVIIDLSADKRFDKNWQYSIPELNHHIELQLISNPGCYATAMQLAIAPLLSLIDGEVHCFGVSGYSGAGTAPSEKNDIDRLQDNLIPYQLTAHLHEKEVSHALQHTIRFSPHVASFFRGISMTIQTKLKQVQSEEELLKLFSHFYADSSLVKIKDSVPYVVDNAKKHHAVIGGFSVSDKEIALNVTLDNLLKGAATQALQNLNIAFNLDSTTGIDHE